MKYLNFPLLEKVIQYAVDCGDGRMMQKPDPYRKFNQMQSNLEKD